MVPLPDGVARTAGSKGSGSPPALITSASVLCLTCRRSGLPLSRTPTVTRPCQRLSYWRASLPSATPWITAWLWCPGDIAAARIAERDTGGTAARLRVGEETVSLSDADISINTVDVPPAGAAAAIYCRLHARRSRA